MRHWQAAGVLLLAFLGGTAGSRRSQLSETELEQRAAGGGAVNQRASTFDPAATAQLDSAFLKDLTGENSTAANANKSFALNLTSPAGANLTRKTVSEVNHDAPVLRIPLSGNRTLSTKPRLSVQNSGFRKPPALDDKPVHSMQDRFISGGTYGAFLDLLVGVRIATPGWGSGFNFCIGKEFCFPFLCLSIWHDGTVSDCLSAKWARQCNLSSSFFRSPVLTFPQSTVTIVSAWLLKCW